MPRPRVPYALLVVVAASLSPALVAQDAVPKRFALGGGVTFQNDADVARRGLHLVGGFMVPLAGAVQARVETSLQHFGGLDDVPLCAPGDVCYSGAGQMTIVSGGVTFVVAKQADTPGAFYGAGGLAVYAITDSPRRGAYTRLGWNFGGGVNLARTVYLEFRYHAPVGDRFWHRFVPITLGVRV